MCLSKNVKWYKSHQAYLVTLCVLMINITMMSFSQADTQANDISLAHTSSQPMSLAPIGNDIYVHHGAHLDIDTGYQGDICNLSVVIGKKGVAVIDTGGSYQVGQQLHDAIRKITPLPILFVINTHVHPDHIYGNAAFVNDHPAFVGHAKLGHAMQVREEAYVKLNEKYLGHAAKGSVLVKPTMSISQVTTLDLGDRALSVMPYVNAHTNTDLSVMDHQTRTLFTGDLVFTERTPVVEGDIQGLISVLESFKTQDIQQIVPGHGPVAKDWKTAIQHSSRYLNVLLADIRAAIKHGVSMEATMGSAASSEQSKWLLFDVANRRNVNTLYPMLEWE